MLLVVNDVYKSFEPRAGERVEVLRGVTFEVARGEMVALVGASGAGKSTLLQVVGGLEARDSGDVRLDGKSVVQQDSRSAAVFRNAEIGFVFQFHHLLPDLSAEENAALPLLVRRAPRRRALDAARLVLDAVGLDARRRHTPGELSGGERQRVAIARALVAHPPLILADEPTGNLDHATAAQVTDLLIRLCHEHHTAALIATHNTELAAKCHRTLRLHGGRVKSEEAV